MIPLLTLYNRPFGGILKRKGKEKENEEKLDFIEHPLHNLTNSVLYINYLNVSYSTRVMGRTQVTTVEEIKHIKKQNFLYYCRE